LVRYDEPAGVFTPEMEGVPMKEEIVAYFLAEKRGALILVVVAIVALAVTVALIATKSRYRGMTAPLRVIAVGELIIGGVLVTRTNGQLAALLDQFVSAPAGMAHAELARKGPVRRNFEIGKIIELLFFAGGVALAYASKRSDFAFAIGIGLIAQAALLLIFDLIAARQRAFYFQYLGV
jgi:hypothetical protein